MAVVDGVVVADVELLDAVVLDDAVAPLDVAPDDVALVDMALDDVALVDVALDGAVSALSAAHEERPTAARLASPRAIPDENLMDTPSWWI